MFAILFPHQQDQIGDLCWGEGCGKGQIGAVDLGDSMAVPCTEETCPHEEKRSESIGTLAGDDDEQIFIRVLKDES